jgi:hypothetical protein
MNAAGDIRREGNWIKYDAEILAITFSKVWQIRTLNYLSQAELPRGAIAKVHYDTGIPYSTLRDWYDMQNWPGQPNWFPLCDGHPAAPVFDDET